MKHLKLFEKFEYENFNVNEIDNFCLEYGIKNYKINEDGSVDVNGDVFLPAPLMKSVAKIPIKFNVVKGDFKCSYNNLTTLENSPNYVGGYFNCIANHLTTLLGGPKSVGSQYYCNNNNLKDAYGLPLYVRGTHIYDNPIWEIIEVKLENGFRLILDNYNNGNNKNIIDRFLIFLNEDQAIRNGDTIIQDRLEEALYGVGITDFPETYNFKNYKII